MDRAAKDGYVACDECLWREAKLVARDRAYTRWIRLKARGVCAVMWLRATFRTSRPPGRLVLHVHGHHCGPGYGGPDEPAPIDALDCACARHDECYGRVALPEAEG